MTVIKCKTCGGDLELTEGMTVAECEYCGTKQAVPNVDSEKKCIMFGRANRLRLANWLENKVYFCIRKSNIGGI